MPPVAFKVFRALVNNADSNPCLGVGVCSASESIFKLDILVCLVLAARSQTWIGAPLN